MATGDHERSSRATPVPAAALLLAGATGLMTVFALAPLGWLHAAALPMALLVPGYALLLAIFGPRARLDLPPALALSLMLTLTIYALLALGLYAFSTPLSRGSVLAGTDALIALLLAAALGRTWALPTVEWPAPAPDISSRRALLRRVFPPVAPSGQRVWRRGGWAAGYLAAAALSGLALFIASGYLPKPVDPPFTQFYLAGSWAHTSAIVVAPPGRTLVVVVGITNQTHRSQQYRITPQIDEAARWPVRELRLGAGQRWTGSVQGTVPVGGCVHHLGITLYIGSSSTGVASLVIWVRGPAGARSSCAHAHG